MAQVSLRDPADNPLRHVNPGTVHVGIVISTDDKGLLVECADLPMTVFVPGSETLMPRSNPSNRVPRSSSPSSMSSGQGAPASAVHEHATDWNALCRRKC